MNTGQGGGGGGGGSAGRLMNWKPVWPVENVPISRLADRINTLSPQKASLPVSALQVTHTHIHTHAVISATALYLLQLECRVLIAVVIYIIDLSLQLMIVSRLFQ